MPGAGYSLDFDAGDMLAFLSAAADLGGDPREVLDEVGAYGVASTEERFELGVDPGGAPWPPSIRARTEGGKTLVRSAQLLSSLTHNVLGDDSVEWGSNKIYAGVHQAGATIRAKDAASGGKLRFVIGQREVFVSEVTIPRRAYLGLSDRDRAEIPAIVIDHLGRLAARWGPSAGRA